MPTAARKIELKDRTLKGLKPAPLGKRTLVWDALQPNLCVRVTDKGRISFVVVRRQAGTNKMVWTVLGQYPTMGLAKARDAAREALSALAGGQHPKQQIEAARQAAEEAARQQNAD